MDWEIQEHNTKTHGTTWDLKSLALLAKQFGSGTPRGRFQGETVEATIAGHKALLLTPLTFMNLSGGSVLAARDFYKIENAGHADRLRRLQPAAGQTAAAGERDRRADRTGLEDMIRRLGTRRSSRGCESELGTPPPGRDATGYVLGRFTKDEQPVIAEALDRAAKAAAAWAESGIAAAMNKYNADENVQESRQ